MGSAIVVGGGLAGLSCAWRLARAGHEVEVLDRSPEPGGRMRGVVRDGFVLDAACPAIFEGDASLRQLVSSLGLTASLRPLQSAESAIARDFALYSDVGSVAGLLRTRLLSVAAKARLLGIGSALLRHRNLDPFQPARAEALDGECFARSLSCRGAAGEELLDVLLEPLLHELKIDAAGESSRGFVLAQLRGRLRRGRRLSFSGGPGVLVGALGALVSIRRDCAVTSVETEADGVRVRYRSGARTRSAFADAAVVALPGCEVEGICTKLTPAERGFFEAVTYTREITVYLFFEEVPSLPGGYRVAFPSSSPLGLRSISVEHQKVGAAPPGAGLLALEFVHDRARAFWEVEDREVAQSALGCLEKTAIGPLRPAQWVVERRSPATPQFPPGALRRLAQFEDRLERSPRLAFAGDYLVGLGAEATVISGGRAANEIARLK